MESLDVLLVQAAAIEGYPPTVNQANILSEAGLSVGLLDMWHPELEDREVLHPAVRRWSVARQWLSYKEPLPPLWRRLLNKKMLQTRLSWIRNNFQPRIEIGYDAVGCALLGQPKKGKTITLWHLHEHIDPELAVSRSVRKAHAFVRKYASEIDLVIVPDAGRAQAMVEAGIVSRLPVVVMNCPRRLENLPQNSLPELLKQQGIQSEQVVLYQGSVSDVQCADIAVRSMPFWPKESVLVYLGPAKEEWKRKIHTLARDCGEDIASRICMLPPVKYRDLFRCTVGAEIGMGLIRPRGDNWSFSSGASNKRFEYMACCVAQVANIGHGMKVIIEENGCGICVDPESPEAVGRAVKWLFENKEERLQMGRNGREAHLKTLNYENAFAPVLEFIRERLD